MACTDRSPYITEFGNSVFWDEVPMTIKSKRRLRKAWRLVSRVGAVLLVCFGAGGIGYWAGTEQTRAMYQDARADAQLEALRSIEGQGAQSAQKLDEAAQKLDETALQVEGMAQQVEATADKASAAAASAGTAATSAQAAAHKAQQSRAQHVQKSTQPPPPSRIVIVPVPMPVPAEKPAPNNAQSSKPKAFPLPWDSPIHKGLPP